MHFCLWARKASGKSWLWGTHRPLVDRKALRKGGEKSKSRDTEEEVTEISLRARGWCGDLLCLDGRRRSLQATAHHGVRERFQNGKEWKNRGWVKKGGTLEKCCLCQRFVDFTSSERGDHVFTNWYLLNSYYVARYCPSFGEKARDVRDNNKSPFLHEVCILVGNIDSRQITE